MRRYGQRAGRTVSALLALCTGAVVAVLPGGVAAADDGQDCTKPGTTMASVPWAQQWLQPDQVWPFSTGSGITVAVLDSGVDAGQSQLSGRVLSGTDVLHGSSAGNTDCVGHGTGVAAIIGARSSNSIGFHGVAPGVKILPVKVSEEADDNGTLSGQAATPAKFAQAIDYAVDHQAKVINISMVMYSDDDAVRTAIKRAVSHGVLVVAAAGNLGSSQNGNPKPYPASYDGVIGVGAIGADGNSWDGSQHGPYVDLVAPGSQITTDQRDSGQQLVEGTSFATPFVSATAALVMSRYPKDTLAQITARLEGTATPAPGGTDSGYYGHGVVNPYQAVVAGMSTASPRALPGMPAQHRDRAAIDWSAAWRRHAGLAALIALGALILAVAVPSMSVAMRHGRRRRWRPLTVGALPPGPSDEPPTPPVKLFDDER